MGIWDFWADYGEAIEALGVASLPPLDKFPKCEVQESLSEGVPSGRNLDRETNDIGLAVSRFLSAVKRMPVAYSRKPKDYDYQVKTVGDDLFRRKMKRELGLGS
jgi:hypothetical protein